jgi:hypothetical protein
VNRWLILLISLTLFSSCGKREGAFLEYRVPSEDTLTMYDIDVYARLHSSSNATNISSVIRVVSPGGEKYSDTLNLKLGHESEKGSFARSGIWRDYRWSYRRGVPLPEKGTWYIRVDSHPQTDKIEGLVEFGLIFIKK